MPLKPSPAPRFATPRTPTRPTWGGRAAKAAKDLGVPFMPWQKLVADVFLEVDGKLPAFRDGTATVPRQQGKSHLALSICIERARRGNQRITYSAQTGLDARKKLIDDWWPLIQGSAVADEVKQVVRSQGSESILFHNGSRIDVAASARDSAHGRTIDLVVFDESWSDETHQREQALLPAMATRADAQLLIISTAGDESSTYFRRKVEAGRLAAEEGRTDGLAFFEWSAHDDDDAEDPAVWSRCMPALGRTVQEAVVRHALATMPLHEFERSFLNRWVMAAEGFVVDPSWWRAAQAVTVNLGAGKVLAADTTPDGAYAAVAICDGSGSAELLDHRPGTGWLENRLVELAGFYDDAPVALDQLGPLGRITERLETLGLTVVSSKMAYACANLVEKLADQRLKIRQHPALDAAIAGARKKPHPAGWTWVRSGVTVDISPLLALTLAVDRAVDNADGSEAELMVSWV